MSFKVDINAFANVHSEVNMFRLSTGDGTVSVRCCEYSTHGPWHESTNVLRIMNTKAIAKALFSLLSTVLLFSLEFICLTGEGLHLVTLCLHELQCLQMLPFCNDDF